MTSHASFPPVVRNIILRLALFPRVQTRFETTTIVVALFFMFLPAFVGDSNAAFGQSYSSEKEVWKSTRPQIEPSATSVSDATSKRANVLLNTDGKRVLTPQTKKSSNLKSYRPNVDSSSLVSRASLSKKKVESGDSSDEVCRSFGSDQGELTEKEKLFGELERRNNMKLLDGAYEPSPGLASFELMEPQEDEPRLSQNTSRKNVPSPYDSDVQSSLSVSLDEEIEEVQCAKIDDYVSGLELYGSTSDPINNEYDSKIRPTCFRNNEDNLKKIEKMTEQFAVVTAQFKEDDDVQDENLTESEKDAVELSDDVDSPETQFESHIVDIDELELEESDSETSVVSDEELKTNGEEKEKIEIDDTLEDEKGVELESELEEVDEQSAEEEEVEEGIPFPTFASDEISDESNDEEESESESEKEIDSDELDVPQTSVLDSKTPDKSIRYSIPSHSILSIDEEATEEESEDEDLLQLENASFSESSVEEKEGEIEEPDDLDDAKEDSNESTNDETSESQEGEEVEEQNQTGTSLLDEMNVDDEATFVSPSVESVVDSSKATTRDWNSKSDERLFPKLRALQRGRQRLLFNGRLLEAPTPPSLDDLDPIVANQKTEPPLLTKENANLPALDDDGKTLESIDPEKFREEAKKFAWTKGAFKIVPYGFLNLSVAADTQRSTPGEFVLYVQSPEVDNSSGFSIDARTSRLGLDIAGPRVEALSADVNGKVEFDFQGTTNGSKNKGGLQLRRAYVELVDKGRERRFLAGQDWEVISAVAPQMLNYLPLGFVGDMQYRRAQVRFEQGWTSSPDLRVLSQIAICDNVLSDYASTPGVVASTSGWPILEARLSSALFGGVRDGLPITFGISGHIGEQNYKFSALAGVPSAASTVRRAIKTWSANFDLDAPISKTQKIQGEVFTGSNLSTFCGGINQGIDLIRREGIRSSGGWLAWHSDCTEKLDVNFGYGIDKPNEKDLVGTSSPSNGYATARTQNQVYFVNAIYNWTPNFMTGLETSYWQTDYQKADVSAETPIFYDMEAGKSTRIEFVTRLSF